MKLVHSSPKKLIMRFSLVFLALIALNIAQLSAQYRKVENTAFNFGERLDYKVGYSFMTAGNGYFQIMPMPMTVDGRKCFDIRFRVYSLESLRWIYQVDDAYRTVMDVEGLFPWMFQQRIREGKYKRDASAKFDHIKKKAYEGDQTHDIPQYAHDIVSAFYYVRSQNLRAMKNGTTFYLDNYFSGKSNKLGVKIHKREIIKVEAGTFKTILIEPMVVDGGLFKNEGHIYIWLTDDDNKIPVKVSTKIVIGDVYAELIKFSGLLNKATAKIG